MEIRTHFASTFWINGATAPRAQQPAPAGFVDSELLAVRLNGLPDVRPEKVEQARGLFEDRDYPARETMQRLAVLLAT